MLVEFTTIVSDPLEEDHDSKFEEDSVLKPPIDSHTMDYIARVAIDLSGIQGYVQNAVYYNSQRLDCIHVQTADGEWTRNLLISLENFKKVLQALGIAVNKDSYYYNENNTQKSVSSS